MKFISLNMIERGLYNEDTQQHEEASRPCLVNTAAIRCFYPRRDDKPGTRITYTDGGGFAVAESFEQVSELVAAGDVHRLALAAPSNAN